MKFSLKPANILFLGLTILMAVIIIGSFIAAVKWVNRPFAGFLLYDFPLAGSMSLKEWPGRQTGLKILDRVVSFDNQQIQKSSDFVEAIREKEEFIYIKTVEIIEREWDFEKRKIRPKSVPIGHSGFLTLARRV